MDALQNAVPRGPKASPCRARPIQSGMLSLLPGFAAPVEASQEDVIPASELSVLRCLLSSPVNSCDDVKRSGERIPKRLQKIYEKLKRPLLNVSNEVVDAGSLEALPASLLYLIPKVRLSSMTGLTASDIVRKFPFDDALAMKILSLFTDKTNIRNFLNGLADREEVFFVSDGEVVEEQSISGVAPISPAVEREIALSLAVWFPDGSQWEYWLYKASMITGTPVLASLPAHFLQSLSLETTEKFLFHLRNWRWDSSKFYDSSWSQHSMAVKRIWSSIVLNKAEPANRWTPRILRKFGFLLLGATPDELRDLSPDLRISHDFNLLLELDWNALQARAVFDVGFSGLTDLTEDNLTKAKDVLTLLLPRQIQQFSHNATDFSFLNPGPAISIPTEKQLFSSHLAFLLSNTNTKELSPALWPHHLNSAGRFYHLLPASALDPFANRTFPLDSLAKADSPSLTFRQAKCLSNSASSIDLARPESVVRFRGILKAVPALRLAQLPSNVVPHSVKEHLLMFSCGHSLPFTASVLEKVRPELAQTSYLEKMLYGKDFRESFGLLASRDITERFREMSSNLLATVSRSPVLERNVRLLPESTLSALLSMHRREAVRADGGWTYDNLLESPLRLYVLGLTCADVEVLETSDFIPVIGYYVHQRRALNQVFPKNMQHCCQEALTRYLRLKMSLRGLGNEPLGLLELLEPHEIRAVGGYILASLPPDVLDALGAKRQIISEIGKLTIPELLTATSLDSLQRLADSYLPPSDTLSLRTITGLGNLLWFLGEDSISRLDPRDFRLHLESLEENAGKALCLNERQRKAWKQLFVRSFGKPDSWSSGTLSTLGDLLFVLDSYELERINRTSWTESADVLAKSTSFYRVVEWPGKARPIYLYESCLEVLKIPERISYKAFLKQLLRYYLESAQFLLETVSPAQTLLKLHEEPNLVENAPSMGSPLISTFVATHDPANDPPPPPDDYDYDSDEDSDEDQDTPHPRTHTDAPPTSPPTPPRESAEQDGEKDDANVFRSKISRSMEELKEEMQRNASRALIIEVPMNRSEFLHFGTAPKRHIEVSCDAIRMLGKPASLILEARDFEGMGESELEDCAEVLGALELDSDAKRAVWSRLRKWKQSGNLMEVGGLVSAVEENDISKIPLRLSEPWALENLHVLSTHMADPEMMSFITDQFLLKNMDLQALTFESAVSLGRLVCTMTLSHQRKYLLGHPGVFVRVAKTLAASLTCGGVVFDSCIRQLASIATSAEAFGDPHLWTASDVSDLGVIVAGLRKAEWEGADGRGLRTEALAGLTPAAVGCIPPEVFRVLREEQLLRMPGLSAAAVSAEQAVGLSPSQLEALEKVRRQTPPSELTSSLASGAAAVGRSLWLPAGVWVGVYAASRTFLWL